MKVGDLVKLIDTEEVELLRPTGRNLVGIVVGFCFHDRCEVRWTNESISRPLQLVLEVL